MKPMWMMLACCAALFAQAGVYVDCEQDATFHARTCSAERTTVHWLYPDGAKSARLVVTDMKEQAVTNVIAAATADSCSWTPPACALAGTTGAHAYVTFPAARTVQGCRVFQYEVKAVGAWRRCRAARRHSCATALRRRPARRRAGSGLPVGTVPPFPGLFWVPRPRPVPSARSTLPHA